MSSKQANTNARMKMQRERLKPFEAPKIEQPSFRSLTKKVEHDAISDKIQDSLGDLSDVRFSRDAMNRNPKGWLPTSMEKKSFSKGSSSNRSSKPRDQLGISKSGISTNRDRSAFTPSIPNSEMTRFV